MRIFVILNPTNKHGTKTEYSNLRKFLKSDGYLKIAQEVYMRITNNRKGYEKHLNRLQDHSPKTGQVMILKLTEKQFSDIYYLTGEKDIQELTIGTNTHIML